MNRCFEKRNMLSPVLASSLFLDIPHSVQVQHTSVKTKVSGFPYSTSVSWCWYIIAAGHQHMATVSCSLLLHYTGLEAAELTVSGPKANLHFVQILMNIWTIGTER